MTDAIESALDYAHEARDSHELPGWISRVLAAEVESLRAAVGRVDEVLDGSHLSPSGDLVVYASEVRQALDGDA